MNTSTGGPNHDYRHIRRDLRIIRCIYRMFGLICWDEDGKIQSTLIIYCVLMFGIQLAIILGHVYFGYVVYKLQVFPKTEIFTVLVEFIITGVHLTVSTINILRNTKFLRGQLQSSSNIIQSAEISFCQTLWLKLLVTMHFMFIVLIILSYLMDPTLDLPTSAHIFATHVIKVTMYFEEEYLIANVFIMSKILRNSNKNFRKTSLTAEQIIRIRMIHHMLSCHSAELSHLFQSQIATLLCSVCVNLITGIFKIIRHLTGIMAAYPTWLLAFTLSILHELLKLVTLGRFCEDIIEEVIKICNFLLCWQPNGLLIYFFNLYLCQWLTG